MVVHLIEPIAPDLRVPRAWPCAARIDHTGQDCGATPAAPFRRICACRHYRDLHLCATHEDIAATAGMATCRDCAGLGRWAHACPVAIIAVPATGLPRPGRLLAP